MSDGQVEPPSTREYLSVVFLNRMCLSGIAVAVAGVAGLGLFGTTRQRALYGTVVALVGVVLFVAGFTLAQHRLSRETKWGH